MCDQPLHIVELRAENVKRLQAVTVRPDGAVVLIGGQNAQGKTSLLDSIEMALGGGKTIPVEPVRRGARKGRIVVDLGEIVVERTFSPKGTALEVRNAEGVPQKSPQALLDSLTAKVCFDPLAFAREEPAKQDAILKQVLGLDFGELDGKRARLYAERRDANRDAKAIEARLDAAPLHAGVPTEEVSVSDLMAELDRMRAVEEEHRAQREKLEAARSHHAEMVEDCAETERLIIEAEERLAALKQDRTEKRASVEAANLELDRRRKTVDAIVEPDTSSVRERIATAEHTNAKVRQNRARKELESELRAASDRADKLSAAIENIDAEKQERLAAAEFPVPGLGFDETGPTLGGIPLSQCSQAERLRVSVAIGAALHPRVRVMLVRDGSLLDDRSMGLLAELAGETGSQLWIERVGDKDESAIIIEDGLVASHDDAPDAA